MVSFHVVLPHLCSYVDKCKIEEEPKDFHDYVAIFETLLVNEREDDQANITATMYDAELDNFEIYSVDVRFEKTRQEV